MTSILSSVIQQFVLPLRADSISVPNRIITGRFKAITIIDNTDGFFTNGFKNDGTITSCNYANMPNGVTVYGDFRMVTLGADTILLVYPF